MTPRHMFGLRPLAGFSDYRSPIAGLYNCGSSTWPGGTVTGAPGHNASRQVLADLERGAGARDMQRSEEIAQAYKRAFGQESVLRAVTTACVSF